VGQPGQRARPEPELQAWQPAMAQLLTAQREMRCEGIQAEVRLPERLR
jgi:hypothetical protein